jgi:hypothetical protein
MKKVAGGKTKLDCGTEICRDHGSLIVGGRNKQRPYSRQTNGLLLLVGGDAASLL